MTLDINAIYAEQVTLNSLVQNLLYGSGTVGAILVVVGLLLIDAGTARRKNLFNSTIEKTLGFFIGFATYYVIGFGFWAAQYYVMVDATIGDSLKDWWIGGAMTNVLAHNVDPAVFPGLNTFQIFIFFLAVFAGIINILLHFAVSERMKPAAFYITCVVATIVSSILSFATWGSVGPLTNAGFHDFFGVGFVYMFPAGMALALTPMLGKRPGMMEPHERVSAYLAPSIGLAAPGLLLIFAGLPMVILSCLFFFDPEALAVSVTMAETSVGVALNNYALVWAGGAITGMLIAYKSGNYAYTLLGPLAGYVAGASGFDVYMPWQAFILGLVAPFGAYIVYEFTLKRGIDEHKLFPLFIGAGSVGMIALGLFKSGTPRGGYLGIEEGAYAFQHGEISLVMQLVGTAVCIGTGFVTALVLGLIFKATIGLRVDHDDQIDGLDNKYWGLEPDVITHADNTPRA
ncbi:ammonium transporter [Roseobacter denitrificans]|uniref:Putative ammonium transporter n=1 Tax=Roseobacter denitrificans (strain ATCC 33942 / OCh 114) TaxID=375451 RepID=Q16BQ1_ROSDO|nr:ammonium transporter [Roseobacter denitrificans]ABG30592.1 putative ammonium transporter [Roseobacter denitrificans OCh 114]AVL53733.1 ammonium transporter [Roseobacter denitrificans]SFG19823.1 ammonium transporter [Roseobacter denitrificans OCh 114]